MSLQARLIKTAMKWGGVKQKLATTGFAELKKELNVSSPPKSLTRNYAIEKITVNGTQAWWINKHHHEKGVMVYLHGGGFIYGPVDYQWTYIASLAERTGMAAVLIDYKKLPEFVFPEGLNGVVGCLQHWMQTKEIKHSWYLIGDSSGGGLALSVCYRLKELQWPQPKKIVLLSPSLDLCFDHPSLELSKNEDLAVDERLLHKIKQAYCRPHELKDPMVSPMYGPLQDLPPMLLQAGTKEILLWDFRRFYFKCLEAKASIVYQEYAGMPHVFATMNFLPEAKKAQRAQIDFILN